ncbi:hypothetical protein AA0K91_06930, partial [Burkholderia multivorans]
GGGGRGGGGPPPPPPQDEVVYAVYPRSPFTSNKLKQFIEHARIALLDPPWGRRDDNDAPANIAPVDMV